MPQCELDATQLVQDLIRYETVSRVASNLEVTNFVDQILRDLGFSTERVDYEDEQGLQKSNVIGRAGPDGCGLAYFGHTDVVPVFNWRGPGGPFDPVVEQGRLYGRGSCDMKGSVACMLAAASQVDLQSLKAPLYITATADEEIGYGGARQVAQQSNYYQEMVASQPRVLIGEPTRLQVVHAHKGTSGFIATSRGEAAHSSSHLGKNANLAMIPFLQEIKAIYDETQTDPRWQDDRFSPSGVSWNIGINDHTAAVNIKAPQSVCTVYFRPLPGMDPQVLLDRAEAAAQANGLEFEVSRGSAPVFTDPESEFIQDLLRQTGESSSSTVCYGTDGGVLSGLKQMAVLGPGDIAQAHTADEWIELKQLEEGTDLYAKLIRHWCQS